VAAVFCDASGIAKRYLIEIGSAWLNRIVDPASGTSTYVARITGVEVVAAVAGRRRQGSISPTDAGTMLAQFRHGFATILRVVEVTPGLVTQAMNLAETHALRGYDAVQLAATLRIQARCLQSGIPFTLISSDAALNLAAAREGVTVEDPNLHP
jgi:predicted nucleic acid-binding protein